LSQLKSTPPEQKACCTPTNQTNTPKIGIMAFIGNTELDCGQSGP
jgi:hypothetical protein